MCEQYVAVAATPFRIADLWPMTERLERYGLAGFGWGATWVGADGDLRSYRDVGSFREDQARERVGSEVTRALLVHLRRPSKFSTIGIPDTQPFDDPAGRYAFSHNGDLVNVGAFRKRYRDAGRLQGKADTEVAARWLEDEWHDAAAAPALLRQLHETFAGHANLAVLTREGDAHHYAGNDENPVFTFDVPVGGETVHVACTGMYSLDRSVFTYVVPEATERRLVRRETTAILSATRA
jgi:glucosamine 6-phosphate synthetase-like amidotransferase/phosphosugar isomerase protein